MNPERLDRIRFPRGFIAFNIDQNACHIKRLSRVLDIFCIRFMLSSPIREHRENRRFPALGELNRHVETPARRTETFVATAAEWRIKRPRDHKGPHALLVRAARGTARSRSPLASLDPPRVVGIPFEPPHAIRTTERMEHSNMRRQSLRRAATCQFLIALLTLGFSAGAAETLRDSAPETPLNAHAKRYGGGWKCDRGYRQANGACAKIEIPPNAYLDSIGHGWTCDRGYRTADRGCAKVELPPNAFFSSRRGEWDCERGFRKTGESCVAIAVPENAYLDVSGDTWKCQRGFRQSGLSCPRLEIPKEGYIGRSGNDFECNRGFRKYQESCAPVEVPSNAYLDSRGYDWNCERGFRKQRNSCQRVIIPLHAHMDSSGSSWSCDSGFRQHGEVCKKEDG